MTILLALMQKSEYERHRFGAVAQLGERQNRTLEVIGSIPFSSISRVAFCSALFFGFGFAYCPPNGGNTALGFAYCPPVRGGNTASRLRYARSAARPASETRIRATRASFLLAQNTPRFLGRLQTAKAQDGVCMAIAGLRSDLSCQKHPTRCCDG